LLNHSQTEKQREERWDRNRVTRCLVTKSPNGIQKSPKTWPNPSFAQFHAGPFILKTKCLGLKSPQIRPFWSPWSRDKNCTFRLGIEAKYGRILQLVIYDCNLRAHGAERRPPLCTSFLGAHLLLFLIMTSRLCHRVARFFLVQKTKMGKIYQMTTKYTKWP
jgi:hypothetical protein